jgi:uncharacterized protein YcbK (DUF882 family)
MSMHARRTLLKFGLGAAAVGFPAFARASELAGSEIRRAVFHNLHTGESLDAVYWDKGAYVPDALSAVDKVLRDFRTGQAHPMARPLLDLLSQLRARIGVDAPFQVISGYRSPKTNEMLHKTSTGVAKRSLHMQGMAIDLRLPGVDLAKLRKAALEMKVGGVGYYPQSDFVHVDVGAVRSWAEGATAA